MHLPAERRLSLALLVVVAVTLVYLVVDDRPGTTAAVTAIALALVKVRIIVREFMDVRHAPGALRALTDALVITMGVCLLGTYLVGSAIA